MDSLGMGLGAPRDELATLQLTELHSLPQTMERQGYALASTKSGLAALRDFASANAALGHVWTAPAVQGKRI